jgi:pantetheine-phosphate adenylyltransferase
MRRVVYPGSFDPVTNGHLDIIRRAAAVWDQVVVSVLVNINKKCRFTVEERVDMLRDVTADMDNVRVDSSRGLLVDYCRREKFTAVVRGLRTIGDFEGELQMAQMNHDLAGVETVFMVMQQKYNFSSSLVKEIVDLGGDASHLVAPTVLNRMKGSAVVHR